MNILKWILKILTGLLLAASLLFAGWYAMQPSIEDVGIPYAESAENDGLTVKWFGVTTLLIDDGETQILIDGYFSRPSLLDVVMSEPIEPEVETISRVLKEYEINRLAAVIPVHSHFDHALDSGEVAKQTGAILLGSESTAHIGRSSALDESQIVVAQSEVPYTYGAFQITLIPSKHAPLGTNSLIEGVVDAPFELPAPYTAWQLGEAYSILVEHPEGRFLVQGSAGFIPDALGELKADAVFLGVGGLRNLGRTYQQAYLHEMVTKTEVEKVFIVHFDDMFAGLGDVDQSKLMSEFDSTYAFEFSQLVLPAELLQLRFAEPVSVTQ